MFGRLFPFAAVPQQPESDQIRLVDAGEVRQWLESGEAILVDVREPGEIMRERIPGAVANPLSSFDPGRVPAAAGKKLVVHCRSGARCGMASLRLLQAGYDGTIHRMQGGLMAWKAVGGPTVSGG